MTNKIHLKTSFNPRANRNVEDLNPSEIMYRILKEGYQYIDITGPPIDIFCTGFFLYVESDVSLLLDSYLNLEDSLLEKESFKHFAFLGDGAVQIEATIDKIVVSVTYSCYPGLDVANLITYTEKMTLQNYVYWWRSIVYDLLDLAG